MRSPKQFLAIALFVFALGMPTFAGDVSGPSTKPVPAPTPINSVITLPAAAAASTVNNATLIEVTLNLLLAALSL